MLIDSILKINENIEGDPEILIQGYGRVRLSQAKQRVARDLEQALQIAKTGNWQSVQSMLYNGTLAAFITAIESAKGNKHD